jgi:hypothetical protein
VPICEVLSLPFGLGALSPFLVVNCFVFKCEICVRLGALDHTPKEPPQTDSNKISTNASAAVGCACARSTTKIKIQGGVDQAQCARRLRV